MLAIPQSPLEEGVWSVGGCSVGVWSVGGVVWGCGVGGVVGEEMLSVEI